VMALRRELGRIGRYGFRVAHEQGIPTFEATAEACRSVLRKPGASDREVLMAALDRLDKVKLRPEDVVDYYAVDVDRPLPLEERRTRLVMRATMLAKRPKPLAWHTVRTDWLQKLEVKLAQELVDMAMRGDAAQADPQVDMATREALTLLATGAALQLVAECNDHGAWHGLLSNGDKPVPLSFSVSTWAAAALLKVFGREQSRHWVDRTVHCVMSSYNDSVGAFGDFNEREPDIPAAPKVTDFTPRDRLTASAIKLLFLDENSHRRQLGMGLNYLIRRGEDGGHWSEESHPGELAADVLPSAYVLDALLKVEPEVYDALEAVLSPKAYEEAKRDFETGVPRWLGWVAEEQSMSSGAWSRTHGGADDPYVTAHIIGFLWQLLQHDVGVCRRVLRYLRTISDDGGFPEEAGGPPGIAPTALIVNGLLRAKPPEGEQLERGGIDFLARTASKPRLPRLGAFAATFALLLGQYDTLTTPGWRGQALRAMEALEAGRASRASRQEIVAAALRPLSLQTGNKLRAGLLEILGERQTA
jgi:hypothetical protein